MEIHTWIQMSCFQKLLCLTFTETNKTTDIAASPFFIRKNSAAVMIKQKYTASHYYNCKVNYSFFYSTINSMNSMTNLIVNILFCKIQNLISGHYESYVHIYLHILCNYIAQEAQFYSRATYQKFHHISLQVNKQ